MGSARPELGDRVLYPERSGRAALGPLRLRRKDRARAEPYTAFTARPPVGLNEPASWGLKSAGPQPPEHPIP